MGLNLYWIWSLILLLGSIFFLFMGLVFLYTNSSVLLEWNLFNINTAYVDYIIYMDWVSMIFSFTVFFVSSMVVIYSMEYMGNYSYGSLRFLLLVLLFVFSMILMIFSPNLISIMLGWDGLGLVSYCLVIYYNSLRSYLAGMITCLINRLGDIGLLISIGWMFSYGSWNFLFYLNSMNVSMYYLLIISSFTKSAQIPFSVWLPAAMAAPTPVSSLVHSSTLVTAGVYLLIRFYNHLVFVSSLFLFVSIMTMIMSSICASYEFDLKKIIALSTLSQLGLMMSCLFMGMVDLAFFHLLSHAMFKSLLFLCSGIIIHLMGGCQDIRVMGSICLTMPITCGCFNISNMALCGFPFLSGFYSKDFIVELSSFMGGSYFTFMLLYMSLGLTSFYSFRLFYYSILFKTSFMSFLSLGDNLYYMKYSIIVLSSFSLSFGCLYMWLTNMDLNFLLLPFYLKLLTLLMVLIGLWFGYEITSFHKFVMFYEYYFINGSMWFMYSFSSSIYGLTYNFGSQGSYMTLWGEFYGGMGLTFYMLKLSNLIQSYTLNSMKIFFITLLFWIIILI